MKGWGYLCSLFTTCLACTLPSVHLVSVVFGTAIPTSLYIFGKYFSYLYLIVSPIIFISAERLSVLLNVYVDLCMSVTLLVLWAPALRANVKAARLVLESSKVDLDRRLSVCVFHMVVHVAGA